MSVRDQIAEVVSQMLKPLRNRVYLMITKAVIETVNDSGGMQVVKLSSLAGEERDEIERFQNFGFSSHPPPNAEAIAVSVLGNRDNLVVIVADDRATRPKDLEEGESVFYNAFGDKLILNKEGTLKGTLSKNMEITLDKLKLQNDTSEIIDILSRCMTALAIEPVIINKATFVLLQTEIETFRVI